MRELPTYGIFANVEEIRWRDQYPNLVKYLDKLKARPSFRETLPEMMDVALPAVVA